MKKLALCLAVLVVAALPTVASANPYACFDWFCDTSTGQCFFSASCSGDDPLDYRWTWGDGSALESHWDDPLAAHTYSSPTASSYVTLSVGYLFIGYYDVTCRIQIRNQISPGQAFFSGTCV